VARIFLYIFFPKKGIVATPTREVRLIMVTARKP